MWSNLTGAQRRNQPEHKLVEGESISTFWHHLNQKVPIRLNAVKNKMVHPAKVPPQGRLKNKLEPISNIADKCDEWECLLQLRKVTQAKVNDTSKEEEEHVRDAVNAVDTAWSQETHVRQRLSGPGSSCGGLCLQQITWVDIFSHMFICTKVNSVN